MYRADRSLFRNRLALASSADFAADAAGGARRRHGRRLRKVATVILQTEFARRYTGGQTRLTVAVADYSALIETLEARFPGFEDSLQGGMAVAIDGEIYQSPLLEKIGAESEVHFLPPIGGG